MKHDDIIKKAEQIISQLCDDGYTAAEASVVLCRALRIADDALNVMNKVNKNTALAEIIRAAKDYSLAGESPAQ